MSEKKIKICIVPPANLPVPSVKGGAVEGLISLLIDENEIENKMDITVISIFDSKAKRQSNNYKNTHFIFIHFNCFFEKIFYKIKVFIFKLFKYRINIHLYTIIYNLFILFKNFDLIIIESADPELSLISKKNTLKKTIGHIHGKMSGTKLMNNKFGYYIAISDFIKNEFLKNSDINSNQVYLLKNGINLSKFNVNISKEEAKNKIGLSNKKIVLFVGRIIKEKGIKELIDAFNMINMKNVKLIVVGSSNFGNKEKTSFEIEIEQLISNNENILHLGYLDNSSLLVYYKAADVTVMPSICEEAAGLVALESLACGTPLIITNSGGLPEYVGKNAALTVNIDNQLVSNLAQSIEKALSSPTLTNSLSSYGKITVKEYSQNNYYIGYYNILCDILKRNQKG